MRLINNKNVVFLSTFYDKEWVKGLGITNEMVPMKLKRGWEQKQRLARKVLTKFFQIVIDGYFGQTMPPVSVK